MTLNLRNRGVSRLVLALVLVGSGSSVRGQDAGDVKKIKELEARLKLAEKENELLKKEIELLKKDNEQLKATKTGEKESGKKSLSDLLTDGKILAGGYRFTTSDAAGEMTLTITERNKNTFKANVALIPRAKEGKPPVDYSVEGEITGTQISFKSVGTAVKVTFSLSQKSNAVEGNFSTSNGGKGTVGLKIPK
ncbi:MAG: hypothetical protein JWO38_4540 [Gemmataceae bacterium]|nr:hypothetical protein [Gemmataceae bacterium]